MMKKRLSRLLFLVFVLAVQVITLTRTEASIFGAPAGSSSGAGYNCAPFIGTSLTYSISLSISGGGCEAYTDTVGYVPHTGYYKLKSAFLGSNRGQSTVVLVSSTSSSVMIDASKSFNSQNLTVSSPSASGSTPSDREVGLAFCYFLVDNETGVNYYLHSRHDCQELAGSKPLPVNPTVPDTSCSINNGSALSVPLGTLDRAELPTTASSGTAKNIPISVNCTGADVTASMKLSFTPITLGSSQAVKTSSNGVGVAILYNGKVLSTSDTTSVTFLKGSNTLNLAFGAVRDATVAEKDIPTGAFSASAVLQMTQQ